MSRIRLALHRGILLTQFSDQCLHLLADRWPAAFSSRFPSPKEPKRFPLPAGHGGWLHHVDPVLPCFQRLGQDDPQEAETCREPWARILSLLDAVLADSQLAFDRGKPRR